jgi:predicted nucleic acid-binding protein
MATTSQTLVVCDAGPLIHLDEIAALDLLSDFSAVFVPDEVWGEVEHHRAEALHHTDVNLSRVIVHVEPDPEFDALVHALILDAGEQAAIRLARQYSGSILLTDDAAARLAAEGLGLRVHGTLGLIIRAARRNLRTPAEVLALLQSLPHRSSLFLRADFLADIIARFKREYRL